MDDVERETGWGEDFSTFEFEARTETIYTPAGSVDVWIDKNLAWSLNDEQISLNMDELYVLRDGVFVTLRKYIQAEVYSIYDNEKKEFDNGE